ncbi:hypothetical protein HOLleu_38993 [Holothuria leucospilota]|uniref:Uncharacterized protein n=1 Tax=Holothuria leucospilota TaxID=206669 RepID=A0A9Q1BBE9_HOLLE|nr:hypothetical protein HOLleu_38993 [Holothuria leucospilota]
MGRSTTNSLVVCSTRQVVFLNHLPASQPPLDLSLHSLPKVPSKDTETNHYSQTNYRKPPLDFLYKVTRRSSRKHILNAVSPTQGGEK